MINLGIIGYGKMGKIRHQVVSNYNHANVLSIYDPVEINIDQIEKILISKL